MPDFSTVQTIEWPPFGCATCGAHTGPFVALNINYPGTPNVGLCVNCGLQIGRMNGMADPGIQESLERQVVDASDRIAALERALDDATKVSLAEAKKLISKQSAPESPAEEPQAAEPEPEEPKKATRTTTTTQRKTRSGSTATRTTAKKT